MRRAFQRWFAAVLVLSVSSVVVTVQGQQQSVAQAPRQERLVWRRLESFRTLTPDIDYSANEVLAIYNIPGTPENAKRLFNDQKLARAAKAAKVTLVSSIPIPARASDSDGRKSQVCGKVLLRFRLNQAGSVGDTVAVLDQQGISIVGGDAMYGVAPQGYGLPNQNDAEGVQPDLWGLEAVKAQDLEYTGKGVRVAVLDTGVTNIPAFSSVAPRNYVLAASPTANANDDFVFGDGHGTGVAGIVAGRDANGQAIGVAPDSRIVPVKVCDKTGHCRDSSVVMGICYAVSKEAGAKVLNLSLGSFINSPIAEGAIRDAGLENAVVVASAGNTREFPAGHVDFNRTIFPAAFSQDATLKLEHLISTGAIDPKFQFADFATANKHVDIVAPGVSVATFKRDGSVFTNAMGGTSYAAPFVSGAAAVMFSKNVTVAARDVKKMIVGTANASGCSAPNPLPSSPTFPTDPNACGQGLLNVADALNAMP
jgi:subtilisin family serine protease